MKILFALNHLGFYRNFQGTIERLCEEGCQVHLVIAKEHKSIRIGDFDRSEAENNPVMELREFRHNKRQAELQRLRMYRDVLFYAGPHFSDATHLKLRFADHQKKTITASTYRRIDGILKRMPGAAVGAMDGLLQRVEHVTKPHATAREVIREVEPDVVVVSPMVHFFTPELEYVKAARAAGIPTVLAVASWDNLTNKGKMKVMPDVVAVWNDAMATEASSLHGVPKDRIVVTGAPVFDWWFDDTARWTREAYLKRAGLDAASRYPLVLYLCSSASIAGGSEVGVVLDWIRTVRNSGEDRLKNAQIVVRPHPMAVEPWPAFLKERAARAEEPDFSIFPISLTHPTNDEQRAFFYNSIFHADAIVGLNTSAMIEAAILSKPVLTFKGHAAEMSQSGNLHFRHLTESGCVRLAADIGEHVGQLESILNDPEDGIAEQAMKFVGRFVRPLGMEIAASDVLAQTILASGKGARKAI